MMEIAFGPVIASCFAQSLFVMALVAIVAPANTVSRRLGQGLAAGGLFGIAHLVFVCAADGFPPRIIQSAGILLLIATLAGLAILALGSGRRSAAA